MNLPKTVYFTFYFSSLSLNTWLFFYFRYSIKKNMVLQISI